MSEFEFKVSSMTMKMARVILFTGQIDAMSKFYGEGAWPQASLE